MLLSLSAVAHDTQQAPNPSNVLGVFGLSIRTQERDLDDEFSKFGRVEKVTIVYDQRVRGKFLSAEEVALTQYFKQSDRSRGFGFIKMATVEDATRCISELNGIVSVPMGFCQNYTNFFAGFERPPYSC